MFERLKSNQSQRVNFAVAAMMEGTGFTNPVRVYERMSECSSENKFNAAFAKLQNPKFFHAMISAYQVQLLEPKMICDKITFSDVLSWNVLLRTIWSD